MTVNDTKFFRSALFALVCFTAIGVAVTAFKNAPAPTEDPFYYFVQPDGETCRLNKATGRVDHAGANGWEPWTYQAKH